MPYHKEVAEDELTSAINAVAIEVHRELGRGQRESLYRDAMQVGLTDEGHDCRTEVEYPIEFRGKRLGETVVDLVVDDEVVVELKAVKHTTDAHFDQLGRNVRTAGVSRGLLINFGAVRIEIRRYVNASVSR